jgi:dual specificity phosphatase 12
MSYIFTIAVIIILLILIFQNIFYTAPIPLISSIVHPDINKVCPGVYITNYFGAKEYEILKSIGIKQILIVGQELPRHGELHFKVLHIKIRDIPDENIEKYFNVTYDFIRRAPTVIHCAAGISRSATIVAAYIMRKYGITANDALAKLRMIRPIIHPNRGFMKQLQNFENSLRKKEKINCTSNSDNSKVDDVI